MAAQMCAISSSAKGKAERKSWLLVGRAFVFDCESGWNMKPLRRREIMPESSSRHLNIGLAR